MKRLISCEGCGRAMQDEGFAFCSGCDIFESDDCPACGGTVLSDRYCSCDLMGPRNHGGSYSRENL